MTGVGKVVLSASLATLATFVAMWLTLVPATVTRAEAQRMIDDRLEPMRRIEAKQDAMSERLTDMSERLARIEERMKAQEGRR